MKKTIALLLALALCLGLCACGGGNAPASAPADADAANGETASPAESGTPAGESGAPEDPGTANDEPAPSDEPEADAPAAVQTLDFSGANTLGAVGELTFDGGFSCEKLEPPLSSGVHISYSPADGKIFVVLSAKFTSAASTKSRVDDLFTAAIAPKGSDAYVTASCYAVTDGGSELDSRPPIDPLATQEVYLVFAVTKGSENDEYVLLLQDRDGGSYTGDFSLAQFQSAVPELKIGDTISDDTIELTVENVYFADSLYPPKAGGYYHYFEADSGKVYLIVKVTATNRKGNDMKYDSIAGVSCIYQEKYNYSSFCVLEEDGGEDLNSYPGQYSIAPLDQGTCYYLMEVPEVVQEGPVTITIYAAGQYYNLAV